MRVNSAPSVLSDVCQDMKKLTMLPLLFLAACGIDSAPEPESELDYHVLSTYSQYGVSLTGDVRYSADAIAQALREHPIHYFERPEGWTIAHKGRTLVGYSQPLYDGSWRIECTPSAFAHEIAHYLTAVIGASDDVGHKDQNWWGPWGVVQAVEAMAKEP